MKYFSVIVCLFVISFFRCSGQDNVLDSIYYAYTSEDVTQIKNSYNLLTNSRRLTNKSDDNWLNCIGERDLIIETVAIPKDSCITYYAYLLSKHSSYPRLYRLFEESQLTQLMDENLTYFNKPEVANLVLSNIRNELQSINCVFFVPSGILWKFALEYCLDTDGQRLCEKYFFYRLTSSSVLYNSRNRRKPYSKVALFGGIDIYSAPVGIEDERYEHESRRLSLSYLDESKKSIEHINDILKSKMIATELYEDNKADESSFKNLSNSDVNAFVIEAHSIFTEDYIITSIKDSVTPLQNHALLFASASYAMMGGIISPGVEDGILTAEEISRLNLEYVDLAVISACKSSLGEMKYDGVYGLLRGFKLAGVNSLVMTTDDVYDSVSGLLWEVFMTNISNGKTKRESLLMGLELLRTIDDGIYSHPKYWSSFVLLDGID